MGLIVAHILGDKQDRWNGGRACAIHFMLPILLLILCQTSQSFQITSIMANGYRHMQMMDDVMTMSVSTNGAQAACCMH